MSKAIRNGPLLCATLSIILFLFILLFPSDSLRFIFGLPAVLFIPGYLITAILYPRRGQLSVLLRFSMSIGLSLAVSAVIGLIINQTQWGITYYSISYTLAVLILAISLVAIYRQWQFIGTEDLTVKLNVISLKGSGPGDRLYYIVILIVVLSMIGAIVYGFVNPRAENFTEFYVVDLEGRADNYVRQLLSGKESMVVICIINNENEKADYNVELSIDDDTLQRTDMITLEHGEKWQQAVSFIPLKPGEDQVLAITLYKGETPYRYLHLWVDVE